MLQRRHVKCHYCTRTSEPLASPQASKNIINIFNIIQAKLAFVSQLVSISSKDYAYFFKNPLRNSVKSAHVSLQANNNPKIQKYVNNHFLLLT